MILLDLRRVMQRLSHTTCGLQYMQYSEFIYGRLQIKRNCLNFVRSCAIDKEKQRTEAQARAGVRAREHMISRILSDLLVLNINGIELATHQYPYALDYNGTNLIGIDGNRTQTTVLNRQDVTECACSII